MTPAALRRRCLALPGAVEEFPFGEQTSVFKVRGKMFALAPLRSKPLSVSLKCDPDLAEQLRASHAAVAPGYHLNKRHDLVVAALPKRVQAELGWPPG